MRTKVVSCLISSVGAFTISPNNKRTTTCLYYREQYDDSRFTKRQLPTGAFGILPEPTIADDQDISLDQYSFTSVIEDEPLISPTLAKCISYSPNLDLPSSAMADNNIEFEKSLEISVGRVAMMAALVLIAEEVFTGASFPEQIVHLID